MKTILLKVEVPDGYSILYPIIVCANHDMLIQGGAVTKEITLPSEDEIMKKYPFNNEAAEVNAYRREGATWLLNKLKGV